MTDAEQNQVVIDVKGLNKKFGDKHVVKDVDLSVKKGEIYGFLGPNGSGKTTTIRMICGLLLPTSGQGTCLGYDIVSQAPLIKQHVGYMTQKYSFYEDLTILENLAFIAKLYNVKNFTEKVDELEERFHFGMRLKQLTGEMSGGWKQQVALAACLLHDPQVLLLDEPTAGVDPKARRMFWRQIHQLSEQGVTTLVSTHYMDEAERCTRLAYIAYGSLLAHGTIEDVIHDAHLVTWQAKGNNMLKLMPQLEGLPHIEQVAAFGQILHVSGTDAKGMEKTLQPFIRDKTVTWERTPATLEDVFISLMSKAKDNF